MARIPRGGGTVRSYVVRTALPVARRGELTLRFSNSRRLRIKRALSRASVSVIVYAGSVSHPIARRKISVLR
jgi:hypothetical protein